MLDQRHNQIITGAVVTVAATTLYNAPKTVSLSVYGGLLLGFQAYDLGTPGGKVYFRLREVDQSLFPQAGVRDAATVADSLWCALPTGVLDVDLERKLEGPPWKVEIDLFNEDSAAHTVQILLRSGDVREQDVNLRTLILLEALVKQFSTKGE